MRWTASRKAAAVENVRNGVLTSADLLTAGGISAEEFAEWERHYSQYGRDGLQTTKLWRYRPSVRSKKKSSTNPTEEGSF
jgi:hypothetical protein